MLQIAVSIFLGVMAGILGFIVVLTIVRVLGIDS